MEQRGGEDARPLRPLPTADQKPRKKTIYSGEDQAETGHNLKLIRASLPQHRVPRWYTSSALHGWIRVLLAGTCGPECRGCRTRPSTPIPDIGFRGALEAPKGGCMETFRGTPLPQPGWRCSCRGRDRDRRVTAAPAPPVTQHGPSTCLIPPILCITVYRPPHHSISFITDFSELLTIIHTTYNRILITNLHVDNTSDPMSREFLNLLTCMDFKQHVTQPTHNRGHTLDLVITYGLSTGVSSIVDLAVSDHYCVYFNITSFSHQEAPVITVRKRYLTSEVAANFIQILQSTPAEILPAPCDFIVDNFNSKLKSTLGSVAPLLTKIIKTKSTPPWRNDDIKRLKRKCSSAERRWRKNKLTVHFEILCKQLKTYNKTVKQARRIFHFSKLISDHKNNPKFLFSTFDLLTSTNFNKPSNISTDALCEDFADHFRRGIR
ncbi:hypothetical protein ABVT39_003721 [Epinephelus coioides]